MNAIEIRGLCKAYPGFQLDNVHFTLPQGCILGLVGENGAGKSTVMKLMLNMIRKDSGTITLLGQDSTQLSKEDIGVVLDEVGISGCLTPVQLGKIMAHSFRNWDAEAFQSYLQRFSLPENKKFKDFSRGMKMKLGIAVALSHNARLLILDEATSGLDPVIRDQILDIFLDFTRDPSHSILISSHIVSDLEKLCDYIAFLHKGKLLLVEEKDLLREQYGLVHCSAEALSHVPASVIIGSKTNAYGAEAILRRDQIPAGMTASPVDIEQLFIGRQDKMKGLLLKDFYAMKSYFKSFILLDLFMILAARFSSSMGFLLFYPCILSGMMAVSLIAYDESEKWDVYAATLPYSKAQLVSGKYITTLLLSLFTISVICAVHLTCPDCAASISTTLLILLPLSLVPAAVLLPFIYKLGSTKGRMAYYMVFGAICGVVALLCNVDNTFLPNLLQSPVTGIGILVSCGLLYGCSWLLSIHFYQRRGIE